MGITTKHKWSILTFLLCAGLALALAARSLPAGTGPDDFGQGTGPSEETQTPEEPPVTIEMIREAVFADIPADDPAYDAAAYVQHYGLLTADADGVFGRHQPLTRGELEAALQTLGGETLQGEKADAAPDAFVTRKDLADALYRTAETLGWGNTAGYREDHPADHPLSRGQLWELDNGLFRAFAEYGDQPLTAVSRAQAAQALTGLRWLGGDALAGEIFAALPEYQVTSAARDNHEAIQAAVDAAAQKYGADGVQVAVVENGRVTDTYATGWATVNTDPMTADHKMRVASISKVAVGMTAMLLREQGVIDLDESIGTYWGIDVKNPHYPDTPVTIRTILSHTSSITNAGDDEPRNYGSVYSRLQNGYFSRAIPGNIGYWSYNNYAFAVLGMTLELAADCLVDDILHENLYNAMGIDASFAAGDVQDTDRLVTLYRSNGAVARSVEMQRNMHNDPTPGASGAFFAGGLTASATDVAKLIALLAGDGRYEGVQLLSEESVELMERYNERAVPGGSYQGLPMRYFPELYGTSGVYFHTGSAYGVYNCATYDPETGNGVVVLTVGAYGDKDDHGIYKVCAEINEFIYGVV
ncbi:MAG: beta-lactamase family protein [Ruminococcaceae bacterium]|nr:beta-lactamase family protein [Oscillospiraceae bacterium]